MALAHQANACYEPSYVYPEPQGSLIIRTLFKYLVIGKIHEHSIVRQPNICAVEPGLSREIKLFLDQLNDDFAFNTDDIRSSFLLR